ncbi:1,4-dihydroxy-6-naphthoate synthase [Desulfonauticus submarinus]|uniref:1,4-dihydroxy-6-naphthoate synthase n=1 Tax=Desulfonauticus submarinus TaxID=206665 RepID=A0A1H0E1M5_9BACT|nr:MqnA/MqnD/SBP family protein [Desulfonauticus submarinus]SDN76280.1 1,4-dihydroxy-6-naphthoate synthase [Desulfonauticus submarinus]
MKIFKIAISPCPNDIFIFGPWILGLTHDLKNFHSKFVFKDVEKLNNSAFKQQFDLIKVSAITGLKLTSKYQILQSGGAFGIQDGPKLVSLPNTLPQHIKTIAVPGLNTTAYHLLKASWAQPFKPVPMIFNEIPNAITQKIVDAGLLIHETALIYLQKGFKLLLDLGKWWEKNTNGLPLPLGVILLHKKYLHIQKEVESKIQESLDIAYLKTQEIKPLLRTFAQEMEEETLNKHIKAYVNQYSKKIQSDGEKALIKLKKIVG